MTSTEGVVDKWAWPLSIEGINISLQSLRTVETAGITSMKGGI